jgi:hypothetical protein
MTNEIPPEEISLENEVLKEYMVDTMSQTMSIERKNCGILFRESPLCRNRQMTSRVYTAGANVLSERDLKAHF